MLIAAFSQYFFGISIFLSSLFLILLVLVQRGRGGGLTGALGGPGGQSAFGTKAGDLFTRITVAVAAVWILLCASAVVMLKSRGLPTLTGGGANSSGSMGTLEPAGNEDAPPAGVLPGGGGTSGIDLPKLDLGTGPANPAPGTADDTQAEVSDSDALPGSEAETAGDDSSAGEEGDDDDATGSEGQGADDADQN